MEEEENGKLPYLDVLISKLDDGNFHLTTFRKPTNTGLLTNFTSFCSYTYKTGLIKTLVDRAHKINTDIASRDIDLSFISKILQKNQFPQTLMRRVMNAHQTRSAVDSDPGMNPNTEVNVNDVRYFKLPYIGKFSSIAPLF